VTPASAASASRGNDFSQCEAKPTDGSAAVVAGGSASAATTEVWDVDEVPMEPPSVALPASAPMYFASRGPSTNSAAASELASDASTTCSGSLADPSLGPSEPVAAAASSPALDRFRAAVAPQLVRRVLNRQWVDQHHDVGYYCKAPLAFLEVGRVSDARVALEEASRYISTGGFGSGCSAYAEEAHVQLPWLWICWAASQLQREDLASACFEKICSFRHPVTDSGLVRRPYHSFRDFEGDFFATAVLCKAAMLCQSTALAAAAGDSLLRVLAANSINMIRRRQFCTRWHWDIGLLDGPDKFYCVSQDSSAGLYYLLGFPAVVLLELSMARVASSRTYREGAERLLEFLKGCRGLCSSPSAHVVAYAAVLAQDNDLAAAITESLLAAGEPGSETFDVADAMDQAAETVIWLSQAHNHLRRTISL